MSQVFFAHIIYYIFLDKLQILQAVIKRLMTDVPFGVLLSGGLDSSLVASVVSRHLAETKVARQWGNKLHTFCIGLKVLSILLTGVASLLRFTSGHLSKFKLFSFCYEYPLEEKREIFNGVIISRRYNIIAILICSIL